MQSQWSHWVKISFCAGRRSGRMLENEQYAFQAAFCYRDEKNPTRVFGSCALEGMEGELRQVETCCRGAAPVG